MKMAGLSVDFSIWLSYIPLLFHWHMLLRRRNLELLTLSDSMFHSVPFFILQSLLARAARITRSPLCYFSLLTDPAKFRSTTRDRLLASAHSLRFAHV